MNPTATISAINFPKDKVMKHFQTDSWQVKINRVLNVLSKMYVIVYRARIPVASSITEIEVCLLACIILHPGVLNIGGVHSHLGWYFNLCSQLKLG